MTLVLGLKENERLLIGKAVVWVERKGNRLRWRVDAPQDVRVLREGAKSQEKPAAA